MLDLSKPAARVAPAKAGIRFDQAAGGLRGGAAGNETQLILLVFPD
jgi:hypothetical protein